MRAISIEKRKQIVAAKERGETNESIVLWVSVSSRTIDTIWRLYRETNAVDALPHKGRASRLTESNIDDIHAMIKQQPDATLEQLINTLKLPIKKSQLSVWLKKNGYSYKKNSTSQGATTRRCCREKESVVGITKRD